MAARGTGDCSVVRHVEVPLELVGASADPPRFLRWQERFALVASGSLTQTQSADVAIVSWHGIDSQAHLALDGLCGDDVCTVLGRALLANPQGDPELVVVVPTGAGSMPAYPLEAKAWDASGAEPATAPLFDEHITAITTRTAIEASANAARALFVIGNIDSTELDLVEIGPDASAVAPASQLSVSSTYWDCLGIVPTREAGAVSAVAKTESGTAVVWHLRELDAQARTLLDTTLTIPVGEALGYTDCPTVVVGPDGFYAQWVSSEQASLVAVAKRGAEPGDEPVLARFDENPGVLAGVRPGELLFYGAVDDEHRGFVRLKADGTRGGAPIVLPALPASTLEHRRARPEVLGIEGSSLYVTYELETARVLEAYDCR